MISQKSRIIQLNTLLQYCTEKGGIFTKGERICINQERAYLFAFNTPQPVIRKEFEYSPQLDAKIEMYIKKIEGVNWMPEESMDINWKIE